MKVMDVLDDMGLRAFWQMTDWSSTEEIVRKYQRDIALAAVEKDEQRIREMQKRLVSSIEAKKIAVRHVCDSVSHAGIDNIKWETDAEKMRAAISLDSKDYIAKPMRLLIITPRGQTKQRHLQIPTYYDRAMQTLYAYSLDPVSEVKSDRKSFAFRKGRSSFDIHCHIIKAFEIQDPPKYIVKTDIKSYYASISHKWLLNNIPMDTRVLRQFIKAGHVFAGELFPPDDFGISLGSSISPILGNMTLDGAQQAVFNGLHGRSSDIDYSDGDLLRFADDIISTARTMESAEKILKLLSDFVAVRGLKLSENKTKIIAIEDGFDFLSRHYQYRDGLIYSTPSDAAVSKIEQSMREFILNYRGGQKALIESINKKLIGWANYHKITEATSAFRHIDNVVKTLLLELCEKLNPHLPRKKIINKYFYREPDGECVYALENKPDVRLQRIINTVLVKHKPVSTKKNPYLDDDYYEYRTDERAIKAVTGKYKPIWNRQKGKCFYCGKTILIDERKTIITIDPTYPNHQKNLAYVHDYCSVGQAEFYNCDVEIESRFDLHELLTRMTNGVTANKKTKFYPLTEYFRLRDDAVFTLTFKEIEKILEKPLCTSAFNYMDYWHRRGENRISFAWLSNGYKIRNINLKDTRIVFERTEDIGEAVEIPQIFLSGRVPPAARAEMEILFDYIRNKYGL
jgi:group II intron reverse transcriptase/maturase